MALLEVDAIHTYYGAIEALRGVSLTVEEGEAVTIIGSNGAGKSTTLRSISGLTPATPRTRSSSAGSPSRRRGGIASRG
jgi:branched-chain amino acid transport system ATP-binding protein